MSNEVKTKNVAIDADLHRQLKVEAARRQTTLYELVEKFLWEGLGLKP